MSQLLAVWFRMFHLMTVGPGLWSGQSCEICINIPNCKWLKTKCKDTTVVVMVGTKLAYSAHHYCLRFIIEKVQSSENGLDGAGWVC